MNTITSMKSYLQNISAKASAFWSREVIFNPKVKKSLKIFSYLYLFALLGCIAIIIKYSEPQKMIVTFLALLFVASALIYITFNYLIKTDFTLVMAMILFLGFNILFLALNGKHIPCISCDIPVAANISQANSDQLRQAIKQAEKLAKIQSR